jgi:hypothetical protein
MSQEVGLTYEKLRVLMTEPTMPSARGDILVTPTTYKAYIELRKLEEKMINERRDPKRTA